MNRLRCSIRKRRQPGPALRQKRLDPESASLRSEYQTAATRIVIPGDERVTEYDRRAASSGHREEPFQIDRRLEQVTAMAWANNNILVHYRCDQQANCALTAPGRGRGVACAPELAIL